MRRTLANSAITPSNTSSLKGALQLIVSTVLYFYIWVGPERGFPPFVPMIPLLLLVCITIWWAWKLVRRESLIRSSLSMPFVALLGAATLSTIFSSDMRLSMEMLLNWLVLVLLFFVCCDICERGGATFLIDTLLTVALLVMLQGAFATIRWYQSWYELGVPEYPAFIISFRLAKIVDYPTQMAGLINFALPFAILRLAAARTLVARFGWSFWLLLADTQLFFCRSRGGWLASLALICITVGWLLLIDRRVLALGSWRWFKATFRIWGTTIVYLLLFVALYSGEKQLSISAFTTNSGGSVVQARGTFWGVAWDMFVQHPLVGQGPLTYGGAFFNTSQANRFWSPPHPHNLLLDIAAHLGLVGLLCFAWLVAMALRQWSISLKHSVHDRSFHNQSAEHSLTLPAICCGATAALAAYLVQSQFDILSWTPFNALCVVALCALGMYGAGGLSRGPVMRSRWLLASLLLPVIVAYVIMRYGESQELMLQAIQHTLSDDWQAVAENLDAAQQIDPHFGFYAGEQAFAYGQLAEQHGAENASVALSEALKMYALSRQVEPDYVPFSLNYAALLDRVGEKQLATQQLNVALKHSGDWALPAFLLAERSSTTDQTAANALVMQGLQSEAHAQDMAICRQSSACQQIAKTLKSDPIRQAHLQAQELIAQGQAEKALVVLREIPLADPSPQPWIDRASAHLALDQLPEARFTLSIANVLQSNRPATAAQAALVAARLALAQDQPANAISTLESQVKPQVQNTEYSYNVFWRIGLPGQLLPSLDRLQRTDYDLQVYRQLATLYTAAGRINDAAWAQSQADALAKLLEY